MESNLDNTPEATRANFNLGEGFYKSGADAQRLITNWPTEIVFVNAEIGRQIATGRGLQAQLPENSVA